MKIVNLSKIGILTLAVATITLGSCKKKGCTDPLANNYNEKAKKDDGTCAFDPVISETEERVSGTITSNTTWTSDMIYILDGKVVVDRRRLPVVEIEQYREKYGDTLLIPWI